MLRGHVPYVTRARAFCYEVGGVVSSLPVFPSALRSAISCDANILPLPTNFIPLCKNMAGDGVLTAKNV